MKLSRSLSPDSPDYLKAHAEIQRLAAVLGRDIEGSKQLLQARLRRDKSRTFGKTNWTASLFKTWQTIADSQRPVATAAKKPRRKASTRKTPISRQRKWQLAREISGRCRSCSRRRAAESKWFCKHHLELSRSRNRERYRNSVNNK